MKGSKKMFHFRQARWKTKPGTLARHSELEDLHSKSTKVSHDGHQFKLFFFKWIFSLKLNTNLMHNYVFLELNPHICTHLKHSTYSTASN